MLKRITESNQKMSYTKSLLEDNRHADYCNHDDSDYEYQQHMMEEGRVPAPEVEEEAKVATVSNFNSEAWALQHQLWELQRKAAIAEMYLNAMAEYSIKGEVVPQTIANRAQEIKLELRQAAL